MIPALCLLIFLPTAHFIFPRPPPASSPEDRSLALGAVEGGRAPASYDVLHALWPC